VGCTSSIHFKLLPPRNDGSEDGPAIDVCETHRDVMLLHQKFMDKFRSDLIATMGNLKNHGRTKAALLVR
jgi:hypothetical protein